MHLFHKKAATWENNTDASGRRTVSWNVCFLPFATKTSRLNLECDSVIFAIWISANIWLTQQQSAPSPSALFSLLSWLRAEMRRHPSLFGPLRCFIHRYTHRCAPPLTHTGEQWIFHELLFTLQHFGAECAGVHYIGLNSRVEAGCGAQARGERRQQRDGEPREEKTMTYKVHHTYCRKMDR